MRIEEERQDVLQNIEFAVASLYRRHPDMKRLVKSVDKWSKHNGRQGYLSFMTQFVQ